MKNQSFALLACFSMLLQVSHAQFSQPGELDTTFNFGKPHHFFIDSINPSPGEGPNSVVSSMALQADGKVLIGGFFTSFNGTSINRTARLHVDGVLDTSFNPGMGPDLSISSIASQPDGKVLIGGNFTSYNGISRNGIARLNANGELDTTFNPGTGVNGTVSAIILQPDGKLFVAGLFSSYNGFPHSRIAKLNADGSLDTSFNSAFISTGTIIFIELQPDGKVLIAGSFSNIGGTSRNRIARLNANGSLDATFNPGTGANGFVNAVALQPDGKIIIGGAFTSFNGTSRNRIARLNANGSLDTSFNPGSGVDDAVLTLDLESSGKVIIAGAFWNFNGISRNHIARLHTDGSLDTTFNPIIGEFDFVSIILVQPNGKVMIANNLLILNGSPRNFMARLNESGALDGTFNPIAGPNNVVHSLAIQPDGKALIGGRFNSFNDTNRNGIARFNLNGELDSTFTPDLGTNNWIFKHVLQPDGKVLMIGRFMALNNVPRYGIARLHANGSLDTTFNPGLGANAEVYALRLLPDGKVLIGGDFTSFNGTTCNGIARLNANGSLDSTFNLNLMVNCTVIAIDVQPDNKVLIGGRFTRPNGTFYYGIVRSNANGSSDTTFNTGFGVDGAILSITLQPDGKVLIGGLFSNVNGVSQGPIARLNPDGGLDSTFNASLGINSSINEIALQSDGKILIGGFFSSVFNISRNHFARLHANGSIDILFDPAAGANGGVYAIAIQPNGQMLLGGTFTRINGVVRSHLARVFAPNCLTTVVNTTSSNAICVGDSKNLIGTTGGGWVIASGPGSIVGTTYIASGGHGIVSIYNLIGGCSSPLVTFRVDSYPPAPTAPTTVSICAGTTTTISPTAGGINYRFYSSATGGSPLAGGNNVANFTTPVLNSNITYFVSSITPAGCESTTRTAVAITVNPIPVVTIVQTGDSLYTTFAPGGYRWFRNGIMIVGAVSASYRPVQSGIYTLRFTSNQGCTGLSNEINVIIAGVSNEATQTLQWVAYPVPFDEQLTIEAPSPFSYQVLDARGSVRFEGRTENTELVILTADLASGMYLVKIVVDGQAYTRKVVRK